MFGRIGNSHTLSQAILLKANNKNVSDKTLNKIANKIVCVKNSATPMQRLLKINTSVNYAHKMNEACNSLQKIKNHTVYEKISTVLGEHSVNHALLHTTKLLKNNIQSNLVSNIFDTLTLPIICKSESKYIGNRIIDFSCLDSLFSYIRKNPDGNFKAITKMAKKNNLNEGHYTCIDVLKKGSKIDLVVYEPVYLQGYADASPDYGVKCLRNVLKKQFTKGKIKPEDIRIGVIEMGIQKSPYDCAIFSVSTAKNLYKNAETSALMFSKLNKRGEMFTRLYDSSAKNAIIDPRNMKKKIDLPPLFLKHSTSKSGVMLSNTANEKVNKKEETLQQRIAGNYQLRDSLRYSNSIEIKREIYLCRLNDSNA